MMQYISFIVSLVLLLLVFCRSASGFGSMGPISAALGEDGFFCAIDASGKQDVICWGKNDSLASPSTQSPYFSNIPAMAALSGGEGFMCGILANTSQAYCWSLTSSGADLVPSMYKTSAYFHIASGKNHVCAVRGAYYSDQDSGIVDCWEIVQRSNRSLSSKESSMFNDASINSVEFSKVVSGDGFSCGHVRDGGVVCWGPRSSHLGLSDSSENFNVLASGRGTLCGISQRSGYVKCWSDDDTLAAPPDRIQFVALTGGAHHFCGIRHDNHGLECWGDFNASSVPKAAGFMAIASSDFATCGIREDDLVLDCWFANGSMQLDYDPPLELCSPGLCATDSCEVGQFAYNASILNEINLVSLCVRKGLNICLPCGSNCSEGFFSSSPCTANADRVCTACSLCQNSSCWDVCRFHSTKDMKQKHWHDLRKLLLISGSSASGVLLVLAGWCLLPRMFGDHKDEGTKMQFKSCIGKPELEVDIEADLHSIPSAPCPGAAQVFRLSELKDATNGFKEFNELGRGSYGFVYKAQLADGRQVAVKRANAATIIHTNSKDFEMELEILCKVRHSHIVNLLGYCSEMGERLLVYEYMPHGTLHDHLHSGLSPLNWSLRLKIAMQAAKGLEYLHKEAVPPIVHRDVKTSNILLDSDWGARIADFGILTSNERDLNVDTKDDVLNFGIVLLEILSGRKAYDRDCTPASITEWAVALIKRGKAAAIVDRFVALPRNVEPLLKLADIAELAVREDHNERPSMSELATWLEQIVKEGLIL